MDSPKKSTGTQEDQLNRLEKSTSPRVGSVEDHSPKHADDPLAQLGLQPGGTHQELSGLQLVATGWNICNSWAAVAGTLAISIASGGSVSLLYGIVVIFVLGGACALTMAELAAVYPTSGGQYHWTSILAPERASRGLSYWCGMINTFGWIASVAGFIAPFPNTVTTLVSLWDSSYVIERWHIFLMYQAVNVIFTAYNIYLLKRTEWVMNVGFFLSIIAFLVITITCLAESDQKQSSETVWMTFRNTSGWSSDAVVFLTGLVNANFIYSGLDGAVHLAEECSNAAVAIPRALITTVVIGGVTAMTFAIAMCYSYYDFDAVLASGFPAAEIFYQATSSKAVATFFTLVGLVISLFAIMGAIQTASRLTWSFARDNALVLSRYISRVDSRWEVPVWALLANSGCVFLLGCVNLGSTTAFNALVSTGLILQQASFAFPAGLLLYHRARGTFGEVMRPRGHVKQPFRLPWGAGPLANALTIVLALISLVFYCLPPVLPATGANMNYASAVIGIMGVLAAANWWGYAAKRYHGPRLEGGH